MPMIPDYEYDERQYRRDLRSASVPAALWEQLQEIDKQRETLRAAILNLVDDTRPHAEMLQMLNALERLAVQWHRMFLDVLAGIEAVKSASIANGL